MFRRGEERSGERKGEGRRGRGEEEGSTAVNSLFFNQNEIAAGGKKNEGGWMKDETPVD